MGVVIKADNISKQYKLGTVGMSNLRDDIQRLVAKIKGKEDPFLKIGEENDRTKNSDANSDFVWALRDISFEINQGDVVGFVGKNGAGKSTLLKILSKVTEPTSGRLRYKGRISSLLEVGTGFHPDLSGRDNVFLNGAILGMTRAEIKNKFDEIVDFSGVERYIDTPVKRYSSGMYVRLAFAVAAHLEPDILIIDEVLAVGDAEFQKKCLGKMKDVGAQGRTVLFVSHNMLAVKSLCNTGLWLNNGTIRKTGPVEEVIDAYMRGSNQPKESFISIEKESNGFHLHSIQISDNGVNGNFEIEKDLVIKVKVSSDRNYESININLFFNTGEGVVIFATCSPAEKFETSACIFECTIPASTLNDSVYIVDVMVVDDRGSALHDIKEVAVINGIEEKREGAWLGKFPGLVRPQYFKWKKTNANE